MCAIEYSKHICMLLSSLQYKFYYIMTRTIATCHTLPYTYVALRSYLLAYLLTYLLTYLHSIPEKYLSTYLLACLLTFYTQKVSIFDAL